MQKLTWWQRGIIYEVYPRSFQDSNGDGIGDLAGIRQRLDYLVSLGVDALWLSPIFPSPMADFGYDIADYCNIDPIFGTLPEFDALLAEVHSRGLKLILDFVPNHTSDQHPWFLESRSSRTNPKRDWYLWRDEPNNWLSNFGGSGWEHDPATGQYYYHSFLKQQPDLNWRNPGVRDAMFDVLRFWLARGVDGFRVDVMWLMIKDDQFRDNPPNPSPGAASSSRLLPLYNADRPEVHLFVAAIRALIDSYPDRVLIGEIYLPIAQLMTYYGKDLTGADLPFNFQLLQCAWSAEAIAQVLSDYHAALPAGAWPNWVLGNHDQPRVASRVGAHQARVAAMLLFTLPGTLTMYYGEELGMTNVAIPPEEVQDPAEKNEPGIGAGRDPERTPMQWDSTPLTGFTTCRPWLPVSPEHVTVNVAAQQNDPESMLSLYRDLLRLRRDHPTLIDGKLQSILPDGSVLRYQRVGPTESLEVILNLGHSPAQVEAAGLVLKSTCPGREGEHITGSIELRAAEGLLLRLHRP
ncbi:MAG TPA: alpha-amylase family glycosyl hydrolase [Acidobacteriaceae bacterium]|jgi:alpha-glucosidase